MTEAKEAPSKPDKLAGGIVEIDLSSVQQVRAPKRSKKLRVPTVDLSRIQEDRVSRNKVFEQLGITASLVLQRHVDNLDAVSFLTIGHGSARKIYAVPDYKTRQKAVEAAEKLLGLLRGDEDLAASQPVIINLMPDTREKVEKLIGEPLQLESGEITEMQPQTPAIAEPNETETADDTTLEGNRIVERADQPDPQPGGQDDRESVDRIEQAGDAYADSRTGDSDDGGEAREDRDAPAGREPIPENGDEAGGDGDYDFSFG